MVAVDESIRHVWIISLVAGMEMNGTSEHLSEDTSNLT